MNTQADTHTAQGISLLLASILISLIGSFAASALSASSAGIVWLVSLTGYLLGIVGAMRLGREGRVTATMFFIGILVMALEQLRGIALADIPQIHYEPLLWYALTSITMIAIFAAMTAAVRHLLERAGAPRESILLGRNFAPWTAVALLLTLLSLLLPTSAAAVLRVCVVMVAFAFMVSALVIGARYLLGARKFFVQRSGRKR